MKTRLEDGQQNGRRFRGKVTITLELLNRNVSNAKLTARRGFHE